MAIRDYSQFRRTSIEEWAERMPFTHFERGYVLPAERKITVIQPGRVITLACASAEGPIITEAPVFAPSDERYDGRKYGSDR